MFLITMVSLAEQVLACDAIVGGRDGSYSVIRLRSAYAASNDKQ